MVFPYLIHFRVKKCATKGPGVSGLVRFTQVQSTQFDLGQTVIAGDQERVDGRLHQEQGERAVLGVSVSEGELDGHRL